MLQSFIRTQAPFGFKQAEKLWFKSYEEYVIFHTHNLPIKTNSHEDPVFGTNGRHQGAGA